ncbi:hypothetical protein Hanom_Chr06g00497981 [Helianthus anomalus]
MTQTFCLTQSTRAEPEGGQTGPLTLRSPEFFEFLFINFEFLKNKLRDGPPNLNKYRI